MPIKLGPRVEGPMLDILGGDDGRIFSVYRQDNGNFVIEEGCDMYFWKELTPEVLIALGNELIAAADA